MSIYLSVDDKREELIDSDSHSISFHVRTWAPEDVHVQQLGKKASRYAL